MHRKHTHKTTLLLAAGLIAALATGCGKVYEPEETARDFTILAGSQIQVTPTEGLGPDVAPGTRFAGVLAEPIELEGELIAPKGAPVVGEIVEMPIASDDPEAEHPLAVELNSMTVHGGQSYAISTVPVLQPETVENGGKPVKEWETMTFTIDEDVEMTLQLDELEALNKS